MKKTLLKKATSILIAMLMVLSTAIVFAEEASSTYIPLNESSETRILANTLPDADRIAADGSVIGKEAGAVKFAAGGELTFRVSNQEKSHYKLFFGVYKSATIPMKNYEVTVDGEDTTAVSVEGQGKDEYVDTSIKFTLEAGDHIIKIKTGSAQHYFYGIEFRPIAEEEVQYTYVDLNESGETTIVAKDLPAIDKTQADGTVLRNESGAVVFTANSEMTFRVKNEEKCSYEMFFEFGATSKSYDITIDDGDVNSVTFTGAGKGNYASALKFTLEAGTHTIKLKNKSTIQFYFYGIMLDTITEEEVLYTYVDLNESGETTIVAKDLPTIDKTQADGSVLRNEAGAVVFAANSELTFRVKNEEKGYYELFFEFGATSKSYDVTIDGGDVNSVTFIGAGKGNYASALKMTLDAGTHTIKVKNKSGSQFYFYGIKLGAITEEERFTYIDLDNSDETVIVAKDLHKEDKLGPDGNPMRTEAGAVVLAVNGELVFRVANQAEGSYELFFEFLPTVRSYDITIDDGDVQSVSFAGAGKGEYASALKMTLGAGKHKIKIKNKSGAQYYFYGIKIAALAESETTSPEIIFDGVAEGTNPANVKLNGLFEGESVDAALAIYKEKDNVKQLIGIDYQSVETAEADTDFDLSVFGIAFEEGYEYSAKIFVLNNMSGFVKEFTE